AAGPCPDADLEPARAACERTRTEIERDDKKTARHGDVGTLERAADLVPARGGIEELELEIVRSGGGTAAVGQAALVGESGPQGYRLNRSRSARDQHQGRQREPAESCADEGSRACHFDLHLGL